MIDPKKNLSHINIIKAMALDGEIDSRIQTATDRAQRIVVGNCNDIEEFELFLSIQLAAIYNIPIFSDYFKNRTLEDLIFEVEVWKIMRQDSAKQSSEILKTNKKEAEGLFDKWAEEDGVTDWVDQPIDTVASKSDADDSARQFMESGKFTTEK